MVLVVLLHAGLALDFYAVSYPEPIRIFNDVFEPYRMPTLMFLSGLLLSKSLSKPRGVYFSGKARKIAWPYAVWTVIALGLQGDLSLYGLGRAVYNPLETHLWYLWFLLIFYTAARLLRNRSEVVVGSVAAASLILSAIAPADFRLDKMTFLFSFFLLGHLYSQSELLQRWSRRPLVLGTAAVLAVAASAVNVANIEVLYEPAFAVCVAGAIILAMWLVPKTPANRARAAIDYLGKRSIVLYIVHLLAIKVVGTLLGGVGFVNPWLLFPVLVVVGIGSSVVLMALADRFTVVQWLFEWRPSRSRKPAAA